MSSVSLDHALEKKCSLIFDLPGTNKAGNLNVLFVGLYKVGRQVSSEPFKSYSKDVAFVSNRLAFSS